MRPERKLPPGLLLLSAFLSLGVFAAPEPTTTNTTHHTLWKVAGPHTTVYLLGSIHVLKPSNYPLAPVIESAFSNATTAVFEADIDEMQQPDTQMKMLTKARLPEGVTLQQVLTTNTYHELEKHATDAGLPLAMLSGLKPFMAVMTLEVLEMQKLGLDPDYGVDQHFFKLARQAGKKIVPLETVDFQVDLVTSLSQEEGELVVKSTLEDIDKTRQSLLDMLAAWQTGDAPRLEKLLNEARQEAPAIFKRMVTDRTARWAPRIGELANGEQPAIVIVGAGHLVGEGGLVDLLRKQGLKVVQE